VASPSHAAARVYAQALFEVAQEQGTVGQVLDEMRALYDLVWGAGNEWLREFVLSPRIDRDTKWSVLRETLEGKVCRPVLGLVKVLIYRGREATLNNIAEHFERFRDQRENRIHASVTVAAPLGDAFKEGLRKRLEAASGKTVTLHERVDRAVLGGAAIRVGDKVIDRTLLTKLKALRKQLLERAAAVSGG
jgi:F-type H+-transporting ATPase subunit delta